MKILSVLLLFIISASLEAKADDIHLYAAGSLRELAAEAKMIFEQQHPEHRVLVNSASSGVLARQIVAGAPADLFLSANTAWMNELVKQEKVAADQPRPWAANRLVVVGRGDRLADIQGLRPLEKIAIGSPQSVPAGRYARTLLQSAGLYRELFEGHRLVMAKDVHQALLYAEQGVVDATLVYASDARRARQARILLVPADVLQPEILYPISLTRQGIKNPAARRLFELLTSPVGLRLIETYGLTPLNSGGAE